MRDLVLPLTQSEEFERTCRQIGVPVRRVTAVGGTCLIQSRRLPVVGTFNLISRGPVLRDRHSGPAIWQQVRAAARGPVAINAPMVAERPPGVKLARGAELAIIDLRDADQMRSGLHQKWRNQLKKAEQSPLTVINQPLDARRHAWFLDAEQAQQKARRYKAYPTSLMLAYAAANTGQARLYTAMLGTRPVAAMLIFKHGLMATYQAGVTTEEGRQYCAHNLVLWTVMRDLERCKFLQLDLGRADLSAGLRRFKCGAGARVEALAGTYLSLPRIIGRRSRPEIEAAAARNTA